MKRTVFRVSALLLALLLALASLPAVAFASGGAASGEITAAPLPDARNSGGLISPTIQSAHSVNKINLRKGAFPSDFRLPDSRLTLVKNQKDFGTCWAFAAMGSSESIAKSQGLIPDPVFSEWQLAYFAYTDQNGLPAFDLGSSDSPYNRGGNDIIAAAMFARGSSPVLESQARYGGPNPSPTIKPSYDLKSWYIAHTSDEWKSLLMSKGALSIGYYQDDACFNASTNSYYCPSADSPNHGVTLVGWKDEYSKSNFSPAPPGDGAWIVKNSWGEKWGDSGYFYLSYYDTGLEQDAGVFELMAPVAGEKEYTYDDLGWVGEVGYGDGTAAMKNVFTASRAETLFSVGTYAVGDSASYSIQITTRNSSGAFVPALSQPQTGTLAMSGYQRIDLAHPVTLLQGQKYEVIIAFTVPDTEYPIPVEAATSYTSEARFAPGQSYVSGNGSSWTDLYGYSYEDCMYAFTKPAQGPVAPAAPTGAKAASASYNSLPITWTAVDGAQGYEIWRSASSGGTYAQVGTSASARYTNDGLATGTTYYYKVRAYAQMGSAKAYSAWSSVASAKPVPAAPASAKAAQASYSSIRVSWGTSAGTTKYELYRATSKTGTYKLVATTASLSYANSGVSTGTAYYYKVRAYHAVGSTKVYGAYSAVVSAKTAIAASKPAKAAKAASRRIKVSWGKVSGATKYEVWRATSPSGKYTKVAAAGSASYTNGGLSKGKTYYYKVRAYRLVGSAKVYGGYSVVVHAKS